MQFILLILLSISSFWCIESNDRSLSFYKTLLNRQVKNDCVPLTNDYCPLVNSLHKIFPSGINNTDWNDTYNQIPDDETLDWILRLGLQQYALYQLNNPPCTRPDGFDLIIQDLLRIITILETKGSTSITWKDLKPHIRRFISTLHSS